MKLRVRQEATKDLKLVQYEDHIQVVDDNGWTIISFLVNDEGNMVLVKARCIPGGEGIEVDALGRILEEPE